MKNQIEESKNKIESEREPVKRNALHLTDKYLLKRIDYDKQISPLRGLTKSQKKKELKMTEEEKEINRKILYNMNLKLNFVKNPRYRNPPKYEEYTTTNFKPINSKDNPFSVEPQEVVNCLRN